MSRIQRAREEKGECPDVWKYNPNYNLRFRSSPKIKFPEIKLKKAEQTEKAELNTHNIIDKDSSIIHEGQHGDLNHTFNSELRESNPHMTDETKRPHINISIKNSPKHKKSIEPIIEEKVPFSRHNKSLQFSKYLPRKAEEIGITANIPYLATDLNM